MITEAEAREYYEQLIRYGTSDADAKKEVAAMIQMQGGLSDEDPTAMSLAESSPGVTETAVLGLLANDAFNAPAMAETLGTGLASTAEANAAWNAAAMGGEVLPEVATQLGPWSMEGIGASGNLILPAAGAALALDTFGNKRHGGRGALQGAASGAMMGSYFGPWGIGIGAGLGLGLGYFGNFGDENKFQTEYNRAQALRDKGINWDLNTEKPSMGRSKEELTAEAARNIAMGQYGNVEFAGSRNETDLRPEDIWGYAIWGEKFGDDWLKGMSEDQRRQISQLALDQGLVREHHGTIDINFTPEFDKAVEDIKSGAMTVETTPWEPGEAQEGPARGTGPYPISINISGGGGQSNANANMTTQALIEMGLSNDESVNLINSYKQLGALTPNEAAQAAYSVGKMKGSM